MSNTKRAEQIAGQIQQKLGSLLQYDMKDPRLGFVTVMSVNVSPDLYHAHVNVSVMGDEAERAETLATLERAKGFLRREVGQELQIRTVPELHFHLDTTLDIREHMDTLFEEVEQQRNYQPPQLEADSDAEDSR